MFACETVQDLFAVDGQGVTLIQVGEAHREAAMVAHTLFLVTGIPAPDFATLTKRHGPIVLENLRPEIAQELAQRLQSEGLETRPCATSAMVVPRLAGSADHLDYDASGLRWSVHSSDAQIPWSAVALLSVAYVDVDKTQSDSQFAASTSVHSIATEATAAFKAKPIFEKALLADLFYALPSGVSYIRMWARHLPYVKLLDTLMPSSLENFRLVLKHICENSPDHQKNQRCSDFLAGKALPPNQCLPSLEAFDEENLKLLKLPW